MEAEQEVSCSLVTVMKLKLLFVFLLVSHQTETCLSGGHRPFLSRSPAPVRLDADLSAASHRVDPRFLSVTIDASLASEERFMSLLRFELETDYNPETRMNFNTRLG